MPGKNFIILIGGPGKFIDCDPKHDKTWLNYIAPMQMAAVKNLYSKGATENVHWFIFEPAYRDRWLDDSTVSTGEHVEKFFFDHELHALRKKAADKILSKGAANYIERIRNIARANAITYHGIQTPNDFWDELRKFPAGSISRVWYSGHASSTALFLELLHDSSCTAIAGAHIPVTDISKNKTSVMSKFDVATTKSSEFYGCGTNNFAKSWHSNFGVPAEGAKLSITFNVARIPGNNMLDKIKTTPTPQGAPGWTVHR